MNGPVGDSDRPAFNKSSVDLRYYVITVICTDSASCLGKQLHKGPFAPVSGPTMEMEALYITAFTRKLSAIKAQVNGERDVELYRRVRIPCEYLSVEHFCFLNFVFW